MTATGAQRRRDRRCSPARAALRRSLSGWRISSPRSGGGEAILGFWYHFAIMFEALFILTIIDAGTRVGRFMLQDCSGTSTSRSGRVGWMPGVIGASAVIVLSLGIFPISRGAAIRWAASIRCGRCSVSPTSCWRPSRFAWPPPSW